MTVAAMRRVLPLFNAELVDCVAPTIPSTTAAVMTSLKKRLLYRSCAKGFLRGGTLLRSSLVNSVSHLGSRQAWKGDVGN